MIDGGAIGEMLGYCMRGDVGIVGAKLLYEDETIQHAGVVLGFGGTAGHAFIGKPRYDTGYLAEFVCAGLFGCHCGLYDGKAQCV